MSVCAHSHRPCLAERGGIRYVNPGSAARVNLPIAVAGLRVGDASVLARIVEICRAPG